MCRPSSAEPQFGWRPTHAAEASCFTLSLCCVFNCLQNSPNFIVSVFSCHFLPIQPPIQECGFLYVIVWNHYWSVQLKRTLAIHFNSLLNSPIVTYRNRLCILVLSNCGTCTVCNLWWICQSTILWSCLHSQKATTSGHTHQWVEITPHMHKGTA